MITRRGTFHSLTYSLCWAAALACDSTPDSNTDPRADFSSAPLIASSTSDSGHYLIDLYTAPEQPPIAGRVAVQLRLVTAAGNALDEHIRINLVPIMPSMGHGTSEVPTAEHIGSGQFVFPSVDLFMSGRWDLVTKIVGAEPDTITFPVDVR